MVTPKGLFEINWPWLPLAIALKLTAKSNLLYSCKFPCLDSAKRESFYALLNALWSSFRTKTEFSTHVFNFLSQLLRPDKQVYWEIESRMQLAGLHCMQHHKESKNPSFARLAKDNWVKHFLMEHFLMHLCFHEIFLKRFYRKMHRSSI